jgi:L-amino acid N-acyltransferase YncA
MMDVPRIAKPSRSESTSRTAIGVAALVRTSSTKPYAAPELSINTLTLGIFAHNEPSLKLFEGFGFEQWAYFPKVAELDSVERDLVILGLKIQ